MASPNSSPDSDIPHQFANVTPDISGGTAQLRIVINTLESTLKEIKVDVNDIKNHRHSDFVFIISVFAAGFVIISGMLIVGYFRLDDKIDGRIKELSTKVDQMTVTTTKIDTKLDKSEHKIFL